MTPERRLGPEEWSRLEELWEAAQGMTQVQRGEMFAARKIDDALREELESLLAHANAGKSLFDRLHSVVAERPKRSRPPLLTADSVLGTRIGHYEISARLGEGGMGIVYRAVDQRLRRTVALKLLRAPVPHDSSGKKRLLAEARAVAALDHPNICTIYEVGETAEHVSFIAMAFYEGDTLEQLLQQGPLPLSTTLDYATQIARGLAAAHERGIIHRDVKPANIIVTSDGVLKLLDFGIARVRDVGVSQEGLMPGTIAYMAPEQITSRPLDRRTDLWSLGVVLYEMCTGVRPFRGDHAGAILYGILHESPPPPSTQGESSPRMHAILDRLLAKNAADRYDSAEQLITDLTAISGAPARAPGTRSTAKTGRSLPYRRVLWYGVPVLALAALLAWWPAATAPPVSERRIAAQDLYGQGNRDVLFRTESGRRQALDLFRQAIAVDPTYATAHAGLAHLLVLSGEGAGGSRRQQLVAAEKAARTAIALDSSLANAHAALGHVLLYEYRLARAEEEFKRAVELDRMQPYVREFLVWLYIFMERPQDALVQAERGAAEHPDSPTAIAEVARALLVNGRCSEALELLKRLMYLQPPPARAAGIAAQCYAQRQQWQQAIAELQPVAERNPLLAYPLFGFMLARAGETERARQIQNSLLELWKRGSTGAYGVAVIHAGLRDYDQAFEWLDKAIEDRSLRYNIMEPAFEDLRRDPRFDRVRKKLGVGL
jgi:tetratricopeptide (TPR) repeat protein